MRHYYSIKVCFGYLIQVDQDAFKDFIKYMDENYPAYFCETSIEEFKTFTYTEKNYILGGDLVAHIGTYTDKELED